MKPYIANLLASAALIILGGWAYLSMDPANRSMTVLIPVIFGVLLALHTPWFKKEGKVAAHLVVILTFLITLMLIMPLTNAIGRGDAEAIFRVGTMMLFTAFSLLVYIQDFIRVRKARKTAE